MAGLARVVAPQRPASSHSAGQSPGETVFSDEDHAVYCRLIAESCRGARVGTEPYCLVPNHGAGRSEAWTEAGGG